MMHELKGEHYRGVLCLCCRQPIPLPAIVIDMESTEDSQEEHGHRVFSLRCRACEREMPYRATAIIEIEGTPRSRASQAQNRAKLLRQQNKLSRAANG